MSLLQMVKDACDELSLPRPTIVVASSDQQVRQLLRLANDEGRSLSKRHNWQVLTSEHSFTTTATTTQVTSIPTDFSRYVPETMFNRTSRRAVLGPIDNSEWQQTKATLVTRVNPTFRIVNNAVWLTPNQTSGQSIYYEYISKNWCQSSGGTAQAAWAADSDTGRLDENLMTLGVIWRFKAAKGMSFEVALANYEREVADAIMRDGSRPRLSMDRVSGERVPRAPMVPETLDL